MPFAEVVFWDNARYNAAMAKSRSRPTVRDIRKEGVELTPDEVVSRLEELGVHITRRTLFNWEKQGMVPQADRSNLGGRAGAQTVYPHETVAEAYAAYVLLHGEAVSGMKLKPERVAQARKFWTNSQQLNTDDSTTAFIAALWKQQVLWIESGRPKPMRMSEVSKYR